MAKEGEPMSQLPKIQNEAVGRAYAEYLRSGSMQMVDALDNAVNYALTAYDSEYVEPLVEAASKALDEPGFAPLSTLTELDTALTKWQNRGKE